MTVTLRTKTGGKVAFAVWKMPDSSLRMVKVTQREYDDCAITRGGIDPPGRPDRSAVFLMAAGGVPALDTVDGFAAQGDAWEHDGKLVIATSGEGDWAYSTARATDPSGGTSRLTGSRYSSSGNRLYLRTYDLRSLPDLTVTDGVATLRVDATPVDSATITTRTIPVDEVIPNHRSVTFDAKATATSGAAASVTFAHVMSASANGYIAVSFETNTDTQSGVTYAAVALTDRLNVTNVGQTTILHYWDLPGPATGTNNVVASCGAGTQITCNSQSATGVYQAAPRSNTNTSSGTSTGPSLTVTSAVGELVFTATGAFNANITTVDAAWQTDNNIDNSVALALATAHIDGAASVTRTDVLAASVFWGMVGASLSAGPFVPEIAYNVSPGLRPRPFAPGLAR